MSGDLYTPTRVSSSFLLNGILSLNSDVLVICCCCLPSETYGRNGATPIFRSFFTELPVPPQAAGVVGTFNVLDIYPSEHYGLSFFLDLTDAIFFTRSPLFFSFFFFFFVYISILQVHFACVLCI